MEKVFKLLILYFQLKIIHKMPQIILHKIKDWLILFKKKETYRWIQSQIKWDQKNQKSNIRFGWRVLGYSSK